MIDKKELYKSALNKAMKLCSQREYCIRDIREKAETWKIGNADLDKLIKTLLDEKFIDESRYSRAYVKDKFRYNKWGKIKIIALLKQKGIPDGIIKEALDELDDITYRDMVIKTLSSRKKVIKAKNQYDLKAKLMRFGLSKGFESALLYEILGDEI